jgi:ribosomal-protein-alanine N-acetyltransferase
MLLIADHLDEFAEAMDKEPQAGGWWPRYWIRNEAGLQRVLIGNGGYGPPNGDTVQIGYAVLDEFHGRGYATEAMRALLDWAFANAPVGNRCHKQIERAIGDTYPHLTPSIRVMEKIGMMHIGPGDEEGTIRYAVTRGEWNHRLRGGAVSDE